MTQPTRGAISIDTSTLEGLKAWGKSEGFSILTKFLAHLVDTNYRVLEIDRQFEFEAPTMDITLYEVFYWGRGGIIEKILLQWAELDKFSSEHFIFRVDKRYESEKL